MTIFEHYVILFIFLSFTRVRLEFNSHLTGDPRSTEITDDNSPTADRPAIQSTQTLSDLHLTDSSAAKHQSTSKSGMEISLQPTKGFSSSNTNPPILHGQSTSQVSTEHTRKDSVSSLESDGDIVNSRTDLQLICMLRTESCWIRTRMSLLQIPIIFSLKNKLTERQ